MSFFDTILFESNEIPPAFKKHLNNTLFLEVEGDDVDLDTDVDLGAGSHNTNVGNGDNSGDATTDANATDSSIDTDIGGKGDQTVDDGTTADDGTSTDDGTGVTDDSANTDDGSGDELDDSTDMGEEDSEKGKKIVLFKNYKSIYELTNNFLEKVVEFKEVSETDETDKSNCLSIEFIEEKLENLRSNIKLILTDKFSTMEYEKLKTIFIYTKSEIDLLLNLFNKISSTKQ